MSMANDGLVITWVSSRWSVISSGTVYHSRPSPKSYEVLSLDWPAPGFSLARVRGSCGGSPDT